MGTRLGAHVFLDEGDHFLQFVKQYGVNDVMGMYRHNPAYQRTATPLAVEAQGPYWEVRDLVRFRERCAGVGLRLLGLENPVPPSCFDHVILGLPGRDRQIENFLVTVRRMGEAGLTLLGYNWMANPPGVKRYSHRTSATATGRGGATITAFDQEVADALPLFRGREYTDDELWENYRYFIQAVIPVAEQAGVRLAVHPDDPPNGRLGGIPRLFSTVAGHERALAIAKSPASGLNMCLGNWTAMGVDIPAAIRHFGARGQIVYGHVQGVQRRESGFRECFLDEADCDFPAIFRALADVGFDGVMIPAHSPVTIQETPAHHIGLSYGFGFVNALIKASA
jgi:mannonate dehydratase